MPPLRRAVNQSDSPLDLANPGNGYPLLNPARTCCPMHLPQLAYATKACVWDAAHTDLPGDGCSVLSTLRPLKV
jgi:hypothetical protein